MSFFVLLLLCVSRRANACVASVCFVCSEPVRKVRMSALRGRAAPRSLATFAIVCKSTERFFSREKNKNKRLVGILLILLVDIGKGGQVVCCAMLCCGMEGTGAVVVLCMCSAVFSMTGQSMCYYRVMHPESFAARSARFSVVSIHVVDISQVPSMNKKIFLFLLGGVCTPANGCMVGKG